MIPRLSVHAVLPKHPDEGGPGGHRLQRHLAAFQAGDRYPVMCICSIITAERRIVVCSSSGISSLPGPLNSRACHDPGIFGDLQGSSGASEPRIP